MSCRVLAAQPRYRDGARDAFVSGADVEPGVLHDAGSEPEARGRVVVAGGHDDAAPGVEQSHEGVVEKFDGARVRQCPVVDVTGNDDGVDLLLAGQFDEVVEVARVRIAEAFTVEGPAEMPVGGVEDAHGSHPRSDHRQPDPAGHADGRCVVFQLRIPGTSWW